MNPSMGRSIKIKDLEIAIGNHVLQLYILVQYKIADIYNVYNRNFLNSLWHLPFHCQISIACRFLEQWTVSPVLWIMSHVTFTPWKAS